MASLYTHRSSNIFKTWLLMSGFFVLVIALGWFVSWYFDSPGILFFAVIFSILMNVGAYWFSDKVVIKMTRATEVKVEEDPELHRIVENIAITAGLPKPKIYFLNEPQPNAFATGRDPEHGVIAVTRGLLERLDRSELEGVIAHEMAHIGNRDMLVATVAVVLAGFIALLSDMVLRGAFLGGRGRDNRNGGGGIVAIIGIVALVLAPIAAMLIRFALSRRREFLADATGALITRYPEGLASALEKIAADPHDMRVASNATAHMFFENPFKGRQAVSGLAKLFLTHPPVHERVAALRGRTEI